MSKTDANICESKKTGEKSSIKIKCLNAHWTRRAHIGKNMEFLRFVSSQYLELFVFVIISCVEFGMCMRLCMSFLSIDFHIDTHLYRMHFEFGLNDRKCMHFLHMHLRMSHTCDLPSLNSFQDVHFHVL